jgi:glycosyltransferase involved in cell wall biosynthesis
MKVLLISHGYPPTGVAGVERLSAQTAAALVERGHQVNVLTRQPSGSPATLALQREIRDGIPVTSIVGAGSGIDRFPNLEPELERIFERILVESTPDVVLATHLLHHSPGYVDIAHRWGTPFVLELHDFFMICPRIHLERRSGELCGGPEGGVACARHCYRDQAESELRWALRSRSFADALSAADEVAGPSPFLAEAFGELRGPDRPIRIIENAVPPLGPVLRGDSDPEGPLRLASIGVTVEHKGFQVVVEALRLAGLRRSSYTVLGVALPPLSRELHAAADRVEGLELRLFNSFSPSHLPVLLADADALVVPSLVAETYSISAREGFACGLPVIASRLGALPEAIREGDNGWLFEAGDAIELADLLKRLDQDRSQLREAAAGIRAEDVTSVTERVDQVEALLHGAVERGSNRHRAGSSELALMRKALVADSADRIADGGSDHGSAPTAA